MANFKNPHGYPRYDVTKKNNGYNYARLRKAHQNNTPFIYFSDYKATGEWMRGSPKLRKKLHMETVKIYRRLLSEVPRGEGTGGHVENALKIRFLKHGGIYNDRMAFHIYAMRKKRGDIGDQFYHAERRSQFSKEAWQKRKDGDVLPNRSGWVDSALRKSAIGGSGNKHPIGRRFRGKKNQR